MEPVQRRHHVIPVHLFQKFLDELFKDENSDMYNEWTKDRCDWGDDQKLIDFEAAVAAGSSATKEFWRKWREEININKTRTPAAQ
jgi:hypothetical protein